MNLFGNKEVIVGAPSTNQDKHRHQPNGDSVVAAQHAWREYEEDMRRHKKREFAEIVFQWFLIIIAVVGFLGVIYLNISDLFNKYGVVVPVSIVAVVMVVFFANRKRG